MNFLFLLVFNINYTKGDTCCLRVLMKDVADSFAVGYPAWVRIGATFN